MATPELAATIEARLAEESFSTTWSYHSRVSTARRYVCVSVPKVGCTTVKRTLRALEELPACDDWGDLHRSADQPMLTGFDPAECARILTSPDWFRFGFVRNPYDRLFSAWKSKIANTWDTQYLFLRTAIRDANDYPPSADGFVPFVSFADYARFVAGSTDPRIAGDGHLDLQTNVLVPDVIPYDVLGRFETFAEDFVAILRRLDAPDTVVALAGEVTNATPQLPLAAAYDRQLANIVYEKYRADFEAFDYDRDSWMYQ